MLTLALLMSVYFVLSISIALLIRPRAESAVMTSSTKLLLPVLTLAKFGMQFKAMIQGDAIRAVQHSVERTHSLGMAKRLVQPITDKVL